MVQVLLSNVARTVLRRTAVLLCVLWLAVSPAWAARKNDKTAVPAPPDILLEGNRKLGYEGVFNSSRDVRGKIGFWTKVLDVVAGEADYRELIRPYDVVEDSRGRLIISDPGAIGVHIFDFVQHKYRFLERRNREKDAMMAPQGVAVDAEDNIYVTDSDAGKIFVWDGNGKFRRVIGSLHGGEGLFKRPTGIAVDSAAKRIYVSDTLRDKVFVLNMDGEVMQTLGQSGQKDAEFHFPTELRIAGNTLAVVDAMNFRIKLWSKDGQFQRAIGQPGDGLGQLFRPKGIGVDSEGHYYVVDGLRGLVQVFNADGELLYYFGKRGTALGEFQLPAGLFIDHSDRIYIVDSYNHRIQIYHYFGLPAQVGGAH
jgi:DNA-binding beta-propeller fold protein YncE